MKWLSKNEKYRKYNVNDVLPILTPTKKHYSDDKKNKIINIILNSKIDFSEPGWIKKVTELINEDFAGFNSAYRLIKENMNDFYREKCYKKTKKLNKEHKEQKVYFDMLKKQNDKKNLPHIEKILKSNIDFTKYGWVKKVAKLIGISENKGGWWMKRYMPDFYNEKCLKRK